MIVVVTRMRTKDLASFRRAMQLAGPVNEQCRAIEGFRGGRTKIDRRGLIWTLTVWSDNRALAAFGKVHAQTASHGDELAAELHRTAWQQDSDAVPTWGQVAARWRETVPPAVGVSKTLQAA